MSPIVIRSEKTQRTICENDITAPLHMMSNRIRDNGLPGIMLPLLQSSRGKFHQTSPDKDVWYNSAPNGQDFRRQLAKAKTSNFDEFRHESRTMPNSFREIRASFCPSKQI